MNSNNNNNSSKKSNKKKKKKMVNNNNKDYNDYVLLQRALVADAVAGHGDGRAPGGPLLRF